MRSADDDGSVGTLDILTTFGPLAAMHAALERQGIGQACSTAAYFPRQRAEEVHGAVSRVAARLPVLSSRMIWRGDQPLLILGAGEATRLGDPLTFRADGTGIWGYRLAEDSGGAWLVAAFAHAGADGLSMLRFQAAVAAELNGQASPASADPARAPKRQRPMALWLPGFLLEHARTYDGLDPANRQSACGACFAILPLDAAERLQQAARGSGVAARLAAAAASAFVEQQHGRAEGEVYLNVPISRGGAASLRGFGFDVGSVRLPLRLSPGQGLDALAQRAGERLRARIEQGWDLNLSRLLAGSPGRRMKFAAIQARKPPDPCFTISWKGRRDGIGARHGVGAIACFAAAPTLHLSGHLTDDGLSLSLTSPQALDARRALLVQIMDRLGLGPPAEVHELADLVAS